MVEVMKALASPRRLQILKWLKDPAKNFPPQVDGDLERDGVCSLFIANKLNVSQPAASDHLKILERAGLIEGKPVKQWVFYRRNEKRIREVKRSFREDW